MDITSSYRAKYPRQDLRANIVAPISSGQSPQAKGPGATPATINTGQKEKLRLLTLALRMEPQFFDLSYYGFLYSIMRKLLL